MNDNEFQTVGLYDHNAESYKKVKSSFDSGNNVVGIVHATGTGKSYIALQLAYDNKDKKIVYVVPSTGIIEHINKIIEDNPKLDLERDFPNLNFRTYQSFLSQSKDEIKDIDCDLLILDEFHHIGAPVWGARINTMVETHPEMDIFGMTAYTVRDRGTSYERDMANPDTNELFSGKIESRYDLCDAMIDGVLPKPIYRSAHTNLIGLESKLEKKVEKLDATTKEYQEYMAILSDVKRRIHEAPSIPKVLKKSIKPKGKYIYFCPPSSEEETNDIETVKRQAMEWFKGFVSEEDIVMYTSTSAMGNQGKKNRDAFYSDVSLDGEKVDDKLRVMFAINQYNEGIHAPNIDGVIMGRGTASDIVYFEQLGRALSVRGNTKEKHDELAIHTVAELSDMCKEKDIKIKANATKEDLIEKLTAPVIIDLTDNYSFIKDLEDDFKDRIKMLEKNSNGSRTYRESEFKDVSFDIEMEDQDLYEMLEYVLDRLTMSWDDKFELARAYSEYYGDLVIPIEFRTVDGYTRDEHGIRLGIWLATQKQAYKGQEGRKINEEQIEKLIEIGMNFDEDRNTIFWNRNLELARAYFEHYGDLVVPYDFKTVDGYTRDEHGVKLGHWLARQKQAYKGQGGGKISEERIEKLREIGMNFDEDRNTIAWNRKYELARKNYEHNGRLKTPRDFKTSDGYTYDEHGVNLNKWIEYQRRVYKGKENSVLNAEQIEKLKEIGVTFLSKDTDAKLQKEEINEKNTKRKQTEIYNRVIDYMTTLDSETMPSKEEINQGFMDNLEAHKKK